MRSFFRRECYDEQSSSSMKTSAIPLAPLFCQAACPQEMGCGSLKHKVWGWGSNEDYNNQKDLYFCLETWLGLVNCFGPVPRKCGIPLSLSSPCTHFMRYLHMRRRLRQQMLQKGNQWIFIQILHSCSSPLFPHCLLFLIHEDGSEWGSVCHVRLGHSCGGGVFCIRKQKSCN